MLTARLGSLLLLAILPAFQGGDRPRNSSDRDPPSRVGRVSFLSGSVSFRPGDVDDWAAATINYPLQNGDHLWTDSDARAEITVGTSAFRLAPQTAFGFLALDDRTLQVRLAQGSLNVRVRNLREDESLEIDTPSGAVSLLRSGTYRVDVDSTGDTTSVTVRGGEAEVSAAGSAFTVHPEQTAVVAGGDAPSYDVRDAIRVDDWEDWCASRDRRWDDARSARYVSHDVIGYEDLDDNGDWRDTPEYGAVWVPRTVVVGWAPYRDGHWAWVEPWGWTWIDDAPWGFAPFHYGRWVYLGGGWAWVPGRVVARPVYAPALVAFVGGRGWSVSVGAGDDIAWFPLAPEEPYYPAYRVSNTYVRNVNVTNVTNVTNINVTNVNITNINYRNRREPDAVTVVSHETFVESRPVHQSVIVVPRERLAQGGVVGFAARVTPTRRSVLAQPAIVPVRQPPAIITTREVVVRRQPAPAPVPFSARQQALAAHPGRPLDDATIRTLRTSTPEANPRRFVRSAAPAPAPARPAVRDAAANSQPADRTSAPVLRPVREGLPPSRVVQPAVLPPPERRRTSNPAPAPVQPSRAAPGAGERSERLDRRGRVTEKKPVPERRPEGERRPRDRRVERDSTREKKPL